MKLQVIKNRFFTWLKRTFLYGSFFLLVSFLIGLGLLQIPAVQKSLASRITDRFGTVSGFRITYNRLHFVWYDRLSLDGLHIWDPQQNLMIEAERLQINFSLSSLFNHHEVNLDGARLQNVQVNLIKLQLDSIRDLNFNFFISEINRATASGKGGSSPKVNIGEIVLDQSAFSYHDPFKDSLATGFDYQHFRLGIPTAEVANFKVIGDTIQMQVRTLVAKDEKTKLAVHELRTFFRISQKGLEFYNTLLLAGNSKIADTVAFFYERQSDLSSFNSRVSIVANLTNTKIDPRDLELFAPGVKLIGQPVTMDGRFRGKVNRFSFDDMNITLGKSLLAGSIEMDGLPHIRETFMQVNLKNSLVHLNDLRFILGPAVTQRLTPMGNLKLNGSFTGFVNDFVAQGSFDSQLGKIISDINLKINPENPNLSLYQGNLQLDQFDLGKLINDTVNFQKVTMNGQIKGRGLSVATTDFVLKGKVKTIGIRGYDYTNISTNAEFAKRLFNGELIIDDPHLKFNALGSIDLRDNRNEIKVTAQLDTAFLHKLGIVKDPLFISSRLTIDTYGLSLDSLMGDALFTKTTIQYNGNEIQLDSIQINSSRQDQNKLLSLNSSIANIELNGNYRYSSLFSDMQRLLKEFKLNLVNEPQAIKEYYASKSQTNEIYHADFNILLKTLQPVSHLINTDLHISSGTKLTGTFSNGYTSQLRFYSQADTIVYHGKEFLSTSVDFNGSKIRDSVDVLAMLTIESEEQHFSEAFKTKNLLIENIWNGDHIDFSLDVNQQNYDHTLRLRSQVDFKKDSTYIRFLPSVIQLLGKQWKIDETNNIRLKGREWNIQRLKFTNENQSILLQGQLSNDADKKLNLVVSNFSLDILKSITGLDLTGTVNGELIGGDFYHQLYVQNDVTISEFKIDQFLIGDMKGTNIWNQDKKRFDINMAIDRMGDQTLSLGGYYHPAEDEGLHLVAHLNKTNLKIAEPFLRGLFSHMGGTLTGQYNIDGTFQKPRISGEGTLENGQFQIDYLKTNYVANGTLGLSPDRIIFRDVLVTDTYGSKGTVNGFLSHQHFKNLGINLDGQFQNFQVLNTTSKDNSLFYGQAYATGLLKLAGPVNNMKITATARTEKKTRIFIPISGTQTVERKDFITFAPFSDSTLLSKTITKKRKVQRSGITMDLNLDITPDAYAEIIFDIKSGDIIRGYGKGEIKLQLDTKGEFNMFGLYEFERGFYNFTLYDIINKEFTINKGSRISWFGDPYTGTLNLTASYRQLASLAPILTDQTLASSVSVRRKYPVEVLLKLDGAMLSPQIVFDITAKELPDNLVAEDGRPLRLQFEFDAFKARLDEQELNKQVFSLIILRRFSPPDAFSTNGSLYNSVSELLSNQLSYWLTQVDSNLEIDLDLGTLDQESFNTFQLRLSYSFFNGRLRVTRDGSFSNQTNRSDVASLAGDWTVDYLLTPDGKFRVKMYSRSNINPLLTSVGNQNAVTTGVSLSHVQNFNRISDLWRSARKRRENQADLTDESDENN